MGRLLRPLTSLLLAILEEQSTALVAASITYGMILGFVPKDNLLAVALGCMLLAWRFNLTVGTTSAAIFSGIAAMFDAVAEPLGRAVLTHPQLVDLWTWLYQVPLMPWTRFNNTVVMGSLLLALGLATPTYLTVHYFLARFRPVVKQWIADNGWRQWLGMAEQTAASGAS
jgi:uncharacterized protein (TIGR03546 family)